MQSDDTRRDAGDESTSLARLAADSIAQRRRSGDCCLVVALCALSPVAAVVALCWVPRGDWVGFLMVLGTVMAVPMAALAWLWSVLALDRRVGPCPNCGEMTTFLGPCPTCKRETPGMSRLVNGGCLVAVLALVVIGGVVGLSWLIGVTLPDEQPGHEPGVWGQP